MNGRVYDPKLGRFLSADPFVQAPANTQSYNRYAYVLNNPLSYTDPDGYFFKKLFGNGVLRSLLSTAISIWLPGAGILIDAVGQWGAVFVSGFAAGVAANGSLRGGVMGAFSSGLFHSIGSAFAACKRCVGSALGSQLNAASLAAKSTLHGIAGGVMNVLQGGKFGHGFASASVTQLASGAIGRIDAGSGRSFNRVAVAAVLGGTVSEVTGGKFANGAIVGAFSRAFNDEISERRVHAIREEILAARDFVGGLNMRQRGQRAQLAAAAHAAYPEEFGTLDDAAILIRRPDLARAMQVRLWFDLGVDVYRTAVNIVRGELQHDSESAAINVIGATVRLPLGAVNDVQQAAEISRQLREFTNSSENGFRRLIDVRVRYYAERCDVAIEC